MHVLRSCSGVILCFVLSCNAQECPHQLVGHGYNVVVRCVAPFIVAVFPLTARDSLPGTLRRMGLDLDYVTNSGNPAMHGVVSSQFVGPYTSGCDSNEAVVAAVGPPAGVYSWDGVWTDSLASDGYGGEFRLCSTAVGIDTIVEGVYSEVRAAR